MTDKKYTGYGYEYNPKQVIDTLYQMLKEHVGEPLYLYRGKTKSEAKRRSGVDGNISDADWLNPIWLEVSRLKGVEKARGSYGLVFRKTKEAAVTIPTKEQMREVAAFITNAVITSADGRELKDPARTEALKYCGLFGKIPETATTNFWRTVHLVLSHKGIYMIGGYYVKLDKGKKKESFVEPQEPAPVTKLWGVFDFEPLRTVILHFKGGKVEIPEVERIEIM